MKIVICTTPIRPIPTNYPPFGSMAIIQALRKSGFDPHFYDIDGLRPDFEAVTEFFKEYQPDVVGISAVVSTAYGYTKKLARMIKRVAPQARIVLGGNMAASAEILHRLSNIDVCVIGEGERIVANLFPLLDECRGKELDYEKLGQIRGLTYVEPDGEMAFTGYELKLPADEVFNPDFEILEKYSRITNFITDPFERPDFAQDPRALEPHRKGKKQADLVTAKGCVARCTFCHRWDKGYRAIPVEQVIDKIKYLMEHYNVGFISFSDENFGSDRRQTAELLKQIKPLDVLWQVGGVRVKSVDPDLLKRMRDAGCVAVYYGMETGSPSILKVMEKKATREDNLNAARWTKEAGLYTVFQLVVAMPGETPQTIDETTDFLKQVTQDTFESPRTRMSINYIQALPGTPVYEYARHKGLIGKNLLDEENYLLRISDIDAADDTKFINFTEFDYLTVRSWRRQMVLQIMHHYHLQNKSSVPPFFSFLRQMLFKKKQDTADGLPEDFHEIRRMRTVREYEKGGYFNISRDLGYDVIVAYFYAFRKPILWMFLLHNEFRTLPLGTFLSHIKDWIVARLFPKKPSIEPISLRETMQRLAPKPKTKTELSMVPLREGR